MIVAGELSEATRSLPHVADPLSDMAEQVFTELGSAGLVERDAMKLIRVQATEE